MGRIVGVLSLELIREGKGNYSKKKKMRWQKQRFHSIQASENSHTKPEGVRIRAEKTGWGRVPGRL